jgi:IclR family acetate operon transcriptional repressor
MPARNHIDLVVKTMSVLEALARTEQGIGLKEIASTVGLVKSSVFRILYTLKELGYVEQSGGSGNYRLSLKILSLVRRSAQRPTLIKIARPHLIRLRDQLQESTWLAERRGNAVILVDVVESPHRLRLSFDVGDRCPIHATALGKSIAAYMSPPEVDALLSQEKLRKFTSKTISNRAEVKADLAKVRRQGFAVNDSETVEGALLIGAPVFDVENRAFAAISVSIPTARCTTDKRREIIVAVKNASGKLSTDLAQLGFRWAEASAQAVAGAP